MLLSAQSLFQINTAQPQIRSGKHPKTNQLIETCNVQITALPSALCFFKEVLRDLT